MFLREINGSQNGPLGKTQSMASLPRQTEEEVTARPLAIGGSTQTEVKVGHYPCIWVDWSRTYSRSKVRIEGFGGSGKLEHERFIMGGSGGSVPEPILIHSLAVEDKKTGKRIRRDITINAG